MFLGYLSCTIQAVYDGLMCLNLTEFEFEFLPNRSYQCLCAVDGWTAVLLFSRDADIHLLPAGFPPPRPTHIPPTHTLTRHSQLCPHTAGVPLRDIASGWEWCGGRGQS